LFTTNQEPMLEVEAMSQKENICEPAPIELTTSSDIKIMVAEDSPICMNVMQNMMHELNLFDNCQFFVSGDFLFEKAN
jgi:hypothetical protein